MAQGVAGTPYDPTELTPGLREGIIEAARLGRRFLHACMACDVPRKTVEKWQRALKTGSAAQSLVDLLGEVESAREVGIKERLRKIDKADDWRAHAWALERLEPETFARRTVVAVGASADAEEFASAVRDTIKGMDFYTRKAGRLRVADVDAEPAAGSSSNGHASSNGNGKAHA